MSGFGKLPGKEGPITKALRENVKKREAMLAQGMDVFDVDRILGAELKAVLGNPRQEPWRFICERCHDSGWVLIDPVGDEAQKLTRVYGEKPEHQGYAERCEPCRWLTQEREKRRKAQGQDEDGLVTAGRTTKPRRW